MAFDTPEEAPYERYVYQASPGEKELALKGLAHFAHDFGVLWSMDIIGPDTCSAFRLVDSEKGREYAFLAPYSGLSNIGSIEQWNGFSTDFPNIGLYPFGTRDMGDCLTVRQLEARKRAYGVQHFSPEQVRNRLRFEKLTKSAWGIVLEYGRTFPEKLEHNNPEKVAEVQSEITGLLLELFCPAFGFSQELGLSLLEELGLISQLAREMCYWMSSAYVDDLNEGRIPESAYPNYEGERTEHLLVSFQRKHLKPEGFMANGDSVQLGGRNGQNPLMAMDALIAHVLSEGSLFLAKK